jgi:hypothetical protein
LINVDIDDVEYCDIDYSEVGPPLIGDETLVNMGKTYEVGEIELLKAGANIPPGN